MERPTSIREDTTARHLRKYSNKNPLHQLTLKRFFDTVAAEVLRMQPGSVLEFGCGEGLFLEQLAQRGVKCPSLLGIDLREDALAQARTLNPHYTFERIDLFDLQPKEPFDLVIASQVLEHLIEPAPFLKRLVELSRRHLLLTVPWEPWFQLMNLLRGRDIKRLGNHPEHVNRWTAGAFKEFVAAHARVENVLTVFPFTLMVAQVPREETAGV